MSSTSANDAKSRQEEAEMWKNVGNRHMANQEYEKAYNAYSTSLSLSPLGPTSHIFLSNRAASLLSLKRYSAAKIDARRAITLAPTFGKAHARLGQSLYFLKDYAGAVAAYEDASTYEPENEVTLTYLTKARKKLARQEMRRARKVYQEGNNGKNNTLISNIQDHKNSSSLQMQQDANDLAHDLQSIVSVTDSVHLANMAIREEMQNEINDEELAAAVLAKSPTNSRNNDNYNYDESNYERELTEGERITRDLNEFSDVLASVLTKESHLKSIPSTFNNNNNNDNEANTERINKDSNKAIESLAWEPPTEIDTSFSSSSPMKNTSPSKLSFVPYDTDSAPADEIQSDIASGLIPRPQHEYHTQHDHDLNNLDHDEDDPDFDEALRLQERAKTFISNKQYRYAVEDLSAALFLVPDDDNLTPQLFVSRAHALNGLQRHESAHNDAIMALKRNPDLPEAHVALARSHFYVESYKSAVESFKRAKVLMREYGLGENLSPLDELYLEKALVGMRSQSEVGDDVSCASFSFRGSSKPVPKLKPPRFVPRELMINATSTVIPPLSKALSDRLPKSPTSLHIGPEHEVFFLSEALGVKLNRGPDGIVRVLSVRECGGDLHRNGSIEAGDVVREAAGLDLRRPITNVMWSDTVALLKISKRPVKFMVAKELSEVPLAFKEEQSKLQQGMYFSQSGTNQNGSLFLNSNGRGDFQRPSFANGIESVAETIQLVDGMDNIVINEEVVSENNDISNVVDEKVSQNHECTVTKEEEVVSESNYISNVPEEKVSQNLECTVTKEDEVVSESNDISNVAEEKVSQNNESAVIKEEVVSENNATSEAVDPKVSQSHDTMEITGDHSLKEVQSGSKDNVDYCTSGSTPSEATIDTEQIAKVIDHDLETSNTDECRSPVNENVDSLEKENTPSSILKIPPASDMKLEVEFPSKIKRVSSSISELESATDKKQMKDIVFLTDSNDKTGLTSLGWSNEKWLATSSKRTLLMYGPVVRVSSQQTFFWSTNHDLPRVMAMYKDPDVLLILRPPKDAQEIRRSLNIPKEMDLDDSKSDFSLVDSFLVVETVVDLYTTKLRLSSLTTPSSIHLGTTLDGQAASPNEQISQNKIRSNLSYFELLTPTKNILISVRSADDSSSPEDESLITLKTFKWESTISKGLLDVHAPQNKGSELDQAWQHQVVLGTIHSHVVSGDDQSLQKALEHLTDKNSKVKRVPSSMINEFDSNGLTALHYACLRRASSTISILLKYGANPCIATLKGRRSPAHISSVHLDEKSLSLILAASNPHHPDPNAIDEYGQTPMYVAIIHGKSIGGKRDLSKLRLCLEAIESWGGQMVLDASELQVAMDSSKSIRLIPHPLHQLSSMWSSDDFEVVLPFCNYRFSHDAGCEYGISKSAMFDYPLHACIIALRRKIVNIKSEKLWKYIDVTTGESFFTRSLRVLLEHGFEPNERIEFVDATGLFAFELNEMIGYTPLQVLALVVIDIFNMKNAGTIDENDTNIGTLSSLIAEAAYILTSHGAKISLDPPPVNRPCRENLCPTFAAESSQASGLSGLPIIDKKSVLIEKDKNVLKAFRGKDHTRQTTDTWLNLDNISVKENELPDEKTVPSSLPNVDLSGGSDDKSCAICWKTFGVVRNRKHVCRSSRRYVCEECSSKSLLINGRSFRVSDGQYNLACTDMKTKKEKERLDFEDKARQRRIRIAKLEEERAKNTKIHHSDNDDSSMKDELFGGAITRAVKSMFSGDDDDASVHTTQTQKSNINGTISSLNQTKQAFHERGEKLNSLADKTSALKDQSRDFARMAKQLREQQEKGGLFW